MIIIKLFERIKMASNRINRYRSMYERLVRPNNASTFPRHVFIRAANLHANVFERVGDRYVHSIIKTIQH